MEVRTAAAIEIGSSKIKGAVAEFCADGHVNVLAVAEVHADNAVRYGRVQNVREVSAAIDEVIRHLENNPTVTPRKINALTLSLGGRSLGGVLATAAKQFPKEIEINEQTVLSLRAEAEKDFLGAKNIEATIARKYYVNNVAVSSAVGTVGTFLRGDFLLLTCARENRQNLERLKFDTVSSQNVEYKLLALAQADMVLSNDDRQLGCALVDFGAETTTISIYKDGTITFLATLPMGSRVITKDLMAGLTLTEAVAEDQKVKHGCVSRERKENATADETEINNYVSARAGEIAANIAKQLNISGVGLDSLGAGIVLIGGGSNLVGFDALLSAQTHLPVRKGALPANVRIANMTDAGTANIGIVSLLLAADDFAPGLLMPDLPDEEPENTAVDDSILDVEPQMPADGRNENGDVNDSQNTVITIDEPRRKPDISDEDLTKDDPIDESEEEDTIDNPDISDRNRIMSRLSRLGRKIATMASNVFDGDPYDEDNDEDNQ